MTSLKRLTDPVEPVYTIGLTGFVFDDTMWMNVYLDTVLSPIRRSNGPADAMTIAGCRVKSKQLDNDDRFPKHFAIINSYRPASSPSSPGTNDPGRVVLLGQKGHGEEKPFVWCGTVAEYEKTWECD